MSILDNIGSGLASLAGILLSTLVILSTNPLNSGIILGLTSIGLVYYGKEIASNNLDTIRGVVTGTIFFGLYSLILVALGALIPDLVGLLFGIITLGTWNTIIALVFAAIIDGLVMDSLFDLFE